MKKIISLILAIMLIVCRSVAVFAEDTAPDQTPQAGSEAPSGGPDGIGTPPDMPEGGMPGGPGT